MIDLRTTLRDATFALPVVVAIAASVGGAEVAFGAALVGVVTLANLGALAWLVDRLARIVEAGGTGGGALFLLGLKLVAALGVYLLLLNVLGPLAVAFGVACGVAGMTGRAVVEALRIPERSAEEA